MKKNVKTIRHAQEYSNRAQIRMGR